MRMSMFPHFSVGIPEPLCNILSVVNLGYN